MDMHSREQYLEALREDYRRANKKQNALTERGTAAHAVEPEVLIRKLAHPSPVPQSGKRRGPRGRRVMVRR